MFSASGSSSRLPPCPRVPQFPISAELRPAFVLSPVAYNGKTGLMLACPITNQAKEYPFEVALHADGVSGVILADHVRSTDWRARKARYAAHAPPATTEEVEAKLRALIEG